MEMKQLLNVLKNQHDNDEQADLTQLEKIIMQFETSLHTNEEQLDKTSSEIVCAKSRISELSKSVQEMDDKNNEISEDMTTLEERLISLERETWKHKQNIEREKERMEVINQENKLLLSNFVSQEQENVKLRKELTELENTLESVCMFIDKYMESDKKLSKYIRMVQAKQNEVNKLRNWTDKFETYSKEIGLLTEFNNNKLKTIENDTKTVVTELESLKVEYDVLKNSIENDSSASSDFLVKIVAKKCRTNYVFFRKNREDQENRLKRLTELLERETRANSKLKLMLEKRRQKNKEFEDAVGYLAGDEGVEVKDEIIFLENSNEFRKTQ